LECGGSDAALDRAAIEGFQRQRCETTQSAVAAALCRRNPNLALRQRELTFPASLACAEGFFL